jgi:hypothetical protein
MKDLDNYEALTARLATMMATLICVLFLATGAASAKTITVTGTGDAIAVDGVVTLREAITAANTNAISGDAPAGDPGLDVINFNIAGGGVQTISPTSALPTITEPITINGYTQPGASANTLAVGSNAVLLIELNGTNAGPSTTGLTLTAGNNTIRGLVINRFAQWGIYLPSGDNNTVAGDFLGTNAAGTAEGGLFPTLNNGIGILVRTANNTIGGLSAADRNVVSGNQNAFGSAGIWLDTANATANKVIGNYIGLNASGTAALQSGTGVLINDSAGNFIGGALQSQRNVISGNGTRAVQISGNSSNNHVTGNYIGLKADGTGGLASANGTGVGIFGTGGGNIVGGMQPGEGNLIGFNRGSGVEVSGLTVNNAILANSIFGNGIQTNRLGIDLLSPGLGVTPNDDNTGDADTGPNNLQNFPVLTSAVAAGGNTTIQGTLDSAPSTQFRVELFSNAVCDPTGFGEGEKFVTFTNVTTNASGKGSFSSTVPTASVAGNFFTATATDPAGNTSEFAACASGVVNGPGTLQLSNTSLNQFENSGSFIINVTRTNGSTGAVTVHYATADGTAQTPSDYTNTSGTLTLNDGETSKPITVPIVDDNTPEGTETFTLTLSSPTGGAVLGNNTTVTFIIQDNEQPTLSISNVSQAEGNSGTTAFTFTVTSSNVIASVINVDYATANGTATAGSDYQATSGQLVIPAGQGSKTITVDVFGDGTQEPDETFFVNLSAPGNATIANDHGTGTIINDDSPAAPTVQFTQASYSVQEDLGAVTITVTRTGDTSGPVSVDYSTADGTATQKSDYEISAGTLSFASGETSKPLTVLINEDMYIEGNEVFSLSLTNAIGASLGPQNTASVTISDDVPESAINPIDNAQNFVHTHYHDFLNREPDGAGLQFWTSQINSCGQDAACIANKRINVSAAYILSIEFQQSGYLLHLLQKESFGGLPKYAAFMRDLQEVSQGIVVNSPGWQQKLAANQQQFAQHWVNRPSFKAAYDGMANAAYVDGLFANAGFLPTPAERDALVTRLDNATETRAQVLLDVTGNAAFRQQEQNSAFVLMQYFGYLRRDPDSGPNSDLSGYYFWLNKLNQFNGDYQQAEMVRAFLDSLEYRGRFGQ